jgi:hypothetical protein
VQLGARSLISTDRACPAWEQVSFRRRTALAASLDALLLTCTLRSPGKLIVGAVLALAIR